MATPAQTGMDKADLKKLLTKSKQEPVNCAIGMGADPSIGLLVLDRAKQGKAVEQMLVKQIPDAKNTRFGRAFVDTDDNPKLVKLYLNKPVSGMARKLVKTLKGTGFNKVEILLDDGSPVESYTEEDATGPGEAPAAAGVPPPPPPPQAEAKPDAAAIEAKLKTLVPRVAALDAADPRRDDLTKRMRQAGVMLKTGNLVYAGAEVESLRRALDAPAPQPAQAAAPPPPPPPPPPTQDAAKPDAAAIEARLKALLPRVMQLNPADPRRENLVGRARQVGVLLKTGNLVYAGAEVESLARALDGAPAAQAANGAANGAGAGTDYAKAGQLWLATRKRVEDDLARLRASLLAAYKDDPAAGEVETRFAARTAPVLQTLNGTLAEALDAAASAKDPAGQAQAVSQARALVGRYTAFAGGDALVADLDANPFVPLTIQKTVTETLAALAKTLG
jgi:hypothetical protein